MHEHPNPPDPSARPMPAYPVELLADLHAASSTRPRPRTSAHISTTTPGLSWRRSIVLRSPTSRPGRWRRRKCPTGPRQVTNHPGRSVRAAGTRQCTEQCRSARPQGAQQCRRHRAAARAVAS